MTLALDSYDRLKLHSWTMAGRSLKASLEGIERAKRALECRGLRQIDLVGEVCDSRQPITKFFTGKPVKRSIFIEICFKLGLEWQEIAALPKDATSEKEQENSSTYNALVQEMRSHSAAVLQPQESTQEGTVSKNTDFVGREEAIADLDKLVNEGAKVILIQAEGGVGKTTLTRKWFEHQGLKVLELSVGTTPQTIYPAEDWVRQKLQDDFKENPELNFRSMLEQLKSKLQAQRIGLLVDNLEPALTNGEFIEPHRSYYLELLRVLAHQSVQSITLVTSRESLHESEVIGLQTFHAYSLHGLKKKAWEKYFDSQKISIDINALSEMHRAYGGNALAMSLLSSDIRKESQGNLEGYWQQNCDDLLRHRAIENLVQRQLNKLREDNLQAHELLCRLGAYPNQDIPSIPKVWLLCLLWDIPEKRRQRVIDAVCARSLVKVSDDGYYLHPVIRTEARDRLNLSEGLRDNLLRLKQQIDELIILDSKLQSFLGWVSYKSHLVKVPYKLVAIRFFYFSLSIDIHYPIAASEQFGIVPIPPRPIRDLEPKFTYVIEPDLVLDFALRLAHVIGQVRHHSFAQFSALFDACALHDALTRDFNSELEETLQPLKTQFPNPIKEERFMEWWQANGQIWTEQLRNVIQNPKTGQDWQFSDEQKKLLQQYYDANKLLVSCLNTATEKVRSYIEDTLLLPMDEIGEIEKHRGIE